MAWQDSSPAASSSTRPHRTGYYAPSADPPCGSHGWRIGVLPRKNSLREEAAGAEIEAHPLGTSLRPGVRQAWSLHSMASCRFFSCKTFDPGFFPRCLRITFCALRIPSFTSSMSSGRLSPIKAIFPLSSGPGRHGTLGWSSQTAAERTA